MGSQPGDTGKVWRHFWLYEWQWCYWNPAVHRMALQPRMLWSPMSIMLTVGYPDLNPNTIAEGISLYSVCLW